MDKKQIIALSLGGLVILGGGAIIGANAFPKTVETTKIVTDTVTKEVPVPGPVQIVEKNVTVLKEVPVDNGNLPAALNFIHDNVNSDVTMDYIIFETNAHMEGEAYINDNMKSLLDDNDFFKSGEVFGNFRKSEVSIKKIYDPIITNQDYDNKDATLTFKVKMYAYEDKDNKKDVYFNVTIPFDKTVIQSSDVEISLI